MNRSIKYTIILASIFLQLISYGQINLIKDINANGSSGSNQAITFKNHIYFVANDNISGSELWITDGTNLGTSLFADIIPGSVGSNPRDFTVVGELLYFTANSESAGNELYRTDGLTSPSIVKEIFPGSESSRPENLVSLNSSLFFTATSPDFVKDLYVINGMGDPLKLTNGLVSYEQGIAFLGNFYFSAELQNNSAGRELFTSNGTLGGTVLLKDLWAGSTVDGNPSAFTVVENKLFFIAETAFGVEPWVSDGTAAGTNLLKDISAGSDDSFPENLTAVGTQLYFSIENIDGDQELWASDGSTTNTLPIKSISTKFGDRIGNFIALDNTLYFSANTTAEGRELWKSDGTEAGTRLIKDINLGSDDAVDDNDNWFALNGQLYFNGNDGITGEELWVSDGTSENTVLIQDLNPGTNVNSSPRAFTAINNQLYFVAFDSNVGSEPRIYDPSSNGGGDGGTTTNITGYVYQFNPNSPNNTEQRLAGVTVENTFTNQITTTDQNGSYEIAAEDGHEIRFYKEEYSSYIINLNLEEGTIYNIPLSALNQCVNVNCPLGEVCIAGQCLQPCGSTTCSENEYCQDGTCLPMDPCEGIFCPLGEICYEGSCYSQVSAGQIKDEQNIPIEDVLLINIASGDTIYSDALGRYYVGQAGSHLISKEGFLSKRMYLSLNGINITLKENSCQDLSCPLGQVCFAGACWEPNTRFQVTFTIKDREGFFPLQDISLAPLNDYAATTITNSAGEATLSLRIGTEVIVNINNNQYESLIITPNDINQEILLSQSDCNNVSCPLGEVCYYGTCLTPDQEIIEGYTFGPDSIPMANVVFFLSSESISSDQNGYFSFSAPNPLDSLFIRISKTGYGTFEQRMYKNCINEVYIYADDPCFQIDCPLGEVCYGGGCYTTEVAAGTGSCENVYCPLGQVCYEGSCYEPCDDGLEICTDNLSNACAGVSCPLGQVCYEGACYDPCDDTNPEDGVCYENAIDPCDQITVPPGYHCINGVLFPNCAVNPRACSNTNICQVINCPPGELCFNCNDDNGINSSGSSTITGQFNLTSDANNSRMIAASNSNNFIFLINQATKIKTAIAKSDESGNFTMENVPSGSYDIYTSIKASYAEVFTLIVNEFDEINLMVKSEEQFIRYEISRITSNRSISEESFNQWYPVPNNGGFFYLNTEVDQKSLQIISLKGNEVTVSYELKHLADCTELAIKTNLTPGLYMLRWKEKDTNQYLMQRILIQ